MKTKLGDVCAHCRYGNDARYVKIGVAFSEPDERGGPDRISLKLDALPLDSSGWTGWVNIFPPKQSHSPADRVDDDIPF